MGDRKSGPIRSSSCPVLPGDNRDAPEISDFCSRHFRSPAWIIRLHARVERVIRRLRGYELLFSIAAWSTVKRVRMARASRCFERWDSASPLCETRVRVRFRWG